MPVPRVNPDGSNGEAVPTCVDNGGMLNVLSICIGASLGGPTGYAINPARDLGPRIAHAVLPIAGKGSSDWAYAWIPVCSPMVGAVLAYVVGKAVGLI